VIKCGFIITIQWRKYDQWNGIIINRPAKKNSVCRFLLVKSWLASSGTLKGSLSVEFLEGGAKINSERYEFKTTFQVSAKQENESSLLPAWKCQTARGRQINSSSLESRFSTLQLPSFASLKDSLQGRCFADNDELKKSVREDFRPFSQELYAKRLTQSGKSL
jgi:hypothetical protein